LAEEFTCANVEPDGEYFCNAVLEASLGNGASLEHVYFDDEAAGARHVKATLVDQGEASTYRLFEARVGAQLSRHDLDIAQLAPETQTTMRHFVLAGKRQLHDLHSKLLLEHPDGTADQVHKAIAAAPDSRNVFDGNVFVGQQAQRTDAAQLTKSLLLSRGATINAKPNLQIIADDVACSHGCTVADLEEDQLFYLAQRGIRETDARAILVSAFGREITGLIPFADLRGRVQSAVEMTLKERGDAEASGSPSKGAPVPKATPPTVLAAEDSSAAVLPPLLQVQGLRAEIKDGDRTILKGLDLTVNAGEVHVIMGKNGCGKSTFSKVLVGHPSYDVTSGAVSFKGKDLLEMEAEERSHNGVFLSFQSPIEIPGVSNLDFLRSSYNAQREARGEAEMDPLEFFGYVTPKLENLKMDPSFLDRNVNEGFSGGERKRNEILQLSVLEAELAVLDEIDSGLDVDALREVSAAVNTFRSSSNAIIIITHYRRLLEYIRPDFVHIMKDGQIIQSGGEELSVKLEAEGYAGFKDVPQPAAFCVNSEGEDAAPDASVRETAEQIEPAAFHVAPDAVSAAQDARKSQPQAYLAAPDIAAPEAPAEAVAKDTKMEEETEDERIQRLISQPYKHGFVTDIASDKFAKGLSEDTVRAISARKDEPEWMLDYRLRAFRIWEQMEEPQWSDNKYPKIDFQNISYYSAPKQKEQKASMDEVDPELRRTFDKLGIPLNEQKRLANVAVDVVFDSVSIATTFQKELEEAGVLFCPISEAVHRYPELLQKHLGKVIPPQDNYFAALNSAVFSDGSFVYVPKGVRCPMELSTYFRINESETGQFERTLIVVEEGAHVSYLEGCTAPAYDTNQLHAAIVELVAEKDAEIKYSTVQNWYAGDENGKGGIYNFVTKRGLCKGDNSKISWSQVETGSAVTWKYPSCVLKGDNSIGEFYSVALTNNQQQADTGTKMIHVGKNTRSKIVSKGISAGQSMNVYRGLVKVLPNAEGARNYSCCDSMLIGDRAKANTYPYIEVRNEDSRVEHEATTSKIGEEQLFYFQQRGIDAEKAVGMIISGFCQDVFEELPLEFAAEVQQLMSLKLENSVG
jgi:FeS assembly protein SufB/FeS assembly ATPase SufC